MKLLKILAIVVFVLALIVEPVLAWDPDGTQAPADSDNPPPPPVEANANIPVPAVTFSGNNDLIQNAVVVPPRGPFPWPLVEDTTGYGNEGSASCVAASGADAWFAFTPVATGSYMFSTFSSSIDTVLTLYSGAPGSLTQKACNDNFWASTRSVVQGDLMAGSTYYLRAAGVNGAAGVLSFSVDMRGAAPQTLTFFDAGKYGRCQWGIGYNDDTRKVWIGDNYSGKVREMTPAGVFTGRAYGGHWADMEYDSGRHLMYQMDTASDRGVHSWNPNTGKSGPTISDPHHIWDSTVQHGVAYDPTTDTLWVSGFNSSKIYHIQGLSGPEPGHIIGSWPWPKPVGLAWLGDGMLGVVSQYQDSTVYVVDTATMQAKYNVAVPGPGGNTGAGIDAQANGPVWLINRFWGNPFRAWAYKVNLSVSLRWPRQAETIAAGSTYNIVWGSLPKAKAFTLKYSLDNGATWKNIASLVTGNHFSWNVPLVGGNNARARIKIQAFGAQSGGPVIGKSVSEPFTIQVVRVISPNGGETIAAGSGTSKLTYQIYPTIKAVAKVVVFLTTNGGVSWTRLTNTQPTAVGTYDYEWTVPHAAVDRTKCKVKVVLKNAAGAVIGKDVSDGWFTIKGSS